jgi:hypothetical protein
MIDIEGRFNAREIGRRKALKAQKRTNQTQVTF